MRTPHHRVARVEPTTAQRECLDALVNGGRLWSWSRAIVLEFLARRDGDRCGVCGQPTDRKLREGGRKVVLDTPVARFGRRRVAVSFDQVRLAHAQCKNAQDLGSWDGDDEA